jgi:preflagellin peptidase FlaK
VAAVLVNGVLAFVLGVVLWLFGLWAAGDAKTFALIAFTLPLSVYRENYLSYFPSFALFFNTFVALFFVLLAEFLVQTGIVAGRTRGSFFAEKLKRGARWLAQNKMVALKLVVFFLALFTFIRIGRHFVRAGIEQVMEMNKTIVYLLLFLMFKPLMRLAQKQWAFIVALLILAGYGIYAFFFDPTGEAKWELVNIGWLAASIILFRGVYDAYLKATDETVIPHDELKKGMILGDSTLLKFQERKQFFKEKVGTIAPDGLSQEQVEALQEWFLSNEPEGMLSVARTIPFAPALFIGAVLTVLANGLAVVF